MLQSEHQKCLVYVTTTLVKARNTVTGNYQGSEAHWYLRASTHPSRTTAIEIRDRSYCLFQGHVAF